MRAGAAEDRVVSGTVAHAPPMPPRRAGARAQLRRVAFWLGLPLLILVLSIGSVQLTTPDLSVAAWWPAAGVCAGFALRAPQHRRGVALLLIFATTGLGNALAERPPLVSVLYGIIDAIEIALLCWLLFRKNHDARLRTTTDAVRLVTASALSSLAFGTMIAVVNASLAGGEPATSAIVTATSHFAAVLLIVPVFLFVPQPQPHPPDAELLLQLVAMTLVLAIAIGLVTPLPLGFLVFVPLVWATLRLPPLLAHAEALVVAAVFAAAASTTFAGRGLFPGTTASSAELALTLTVFLATVGVFTVAATTERNESLMNAQVAVHAAERGAEAARATTAALQLRYDLERQRQDFLSTTSHELRTPITIISGYGELLSEIDLPDEAAVWVEAIHRNTGRLASMLDDLLAFSRTQAERPRPAGIAVPELVATALRPLSAAAAAKNLTIAVADTQGLVVHADRDDAARSLGNLISNAVKFTPEGGRIDIDSVEVGDDTMISVVDTGPGLRPDALDQAFDPFYRGEQSGARAMSGTGLGLPIARMLARRNGGEVLLVSLPGGGAKASLLLPRTAGAGDEAENSGVGQ